VPNGRGGHVLAYEKDPDNRSAARGRTGLERSYRYRHSCATQRQLRSGGPPGPVTGRGEGITPRARPGGRSGFLTGVNCEHGPSPGLRGCDGHVKRFAEHA
jgi:hypothetical protein